MMKQMGKETEIVELENQRKVFNMIQMQNMQKFMPQKLAQNNTTTPPDNPPNNNNNIQNVNINNMNINITQQVDKTPARKGSNIPNIKELMSHKGSFNNDNEQKDTKDSKDTTLP